MLSHYLILGSNKYKIRLVKKLLYNSGQIKRNTREISNVFISVGTVTTLITSDLSNHLKWNSIYDMKFVL